MPKRFLLTFTLATIFFLINHLTIIESLFNFCTNSRDPLSCHEIITEASHTSSSPHQIFQTIVTKSLKEINTTHNVAINIKRGINNRSQKAALDSCILLMDLSHDRLVMSDSAVNNGQFFDARAWLSAVLTNHGTCLDGLNGSVKSDLETHLKILRDQTSTLLAMLKSISSPSKTAH